MKSFVLLTLAFLALISPSVLFAHEGEVSFEKEMGDYVVDIGYKPEVLVENEPAIFDFKIRDKQGNDLDFTGVMVEIKQAGELLFATKVAKSAAEESTLFLTLPSSGEYELSAKIENKEVVLAEAVFPISVAKGSTKVEETQNSSANSVILPFAAGAVVGGLLIFLIIKRL